ncbi:mitochondrial genome maintenance exonuclease 1-like [Ptychodera flava]|uniref:mitochondrial genome maintenance exonuclease 1-like n=1 Tax=Ptychodera flava TaxID=63121 RepID=UPI00396A903E
MMLSAVRRGPLESIRLNIGGVSSWNIDQCMPKLTNRSCYGTSTVKIIRIGPKAVQGLETRRRIMKVAKKTDASVVNEHLDPVTNEINELKTKSLAVFPMLQAADFRKEDWKYISTHTKKSKRFPSVTHVLKETMPLNNFLMLLRWKQKMIREMGEEGFIKFNDQMLKEGRELHKCIQMYLSGTPLDDIDVDEENQGHWKSLSQILPQITDVVAIEKYIRHPILQYAGYLDCLAMYKGKLCVIDWKTSKKPKPTLSKCYDSPLQTAAYTGAVNFCNQLDVEVVNSLLVIAYKNGQKADVHFMPVKSTQFYWEKWLRRLYTYQLLKVKEEEALTESDED